eukprot:6564215-Lingulodinium_polyedra.AAC.1
MTSEDTGLHRDSVGICYFEGEWVAVERVQASDVARWKAEKREGPGRDPRLLPYREATSKFRSMRDALGDSAP